MNTTSPIYTTFGVTTLGSLLALIAPAYAQNAPQMSAGAVGTPYVATYSPNVVSAHVYARGGGPRVDEMFTRPVGDGCTYVARLEGRATAEMRVNAALDCPDGVTRIRERAVNGAAMSAPELAHTLGAAASVVRFSHGRDCTFAPSFAVDGDRVAGRAVNESCDNAPKVHGAETSAPVDERFARDMDNGCEYRAVVRGTMRTQGGAYAPDLRVRASVHCANVDAIDAPERSVRAASGAIGAIAHRVDSAGVVTTRQGDQQCTYAPSFSVEASGDVTGNSVSYTCQGTHGEPGARGGVYTPPADATVAE